MTDPRIIDVIAWFYCALGLELLVTSTYGVMLCYRRPDPRVEVQAELTKAYEHGGTPEMLQEYKRQRPALVAQPVVPEQLLTSGQPTYWATTDAGDWVPHYHGGTSSAPMGIGTTNWGESWTT